jgi:hypothetical protein
LSKPKTEKRPRIHPAVAVSAILGVTAITIVALINHIDSALVLTAFTLIGFIAGVKVRSLGVT